MIILDPYRDGCTVWILSPIIGNKVTNIKGNVVEVCKSLIKRLAVYREVKNQWGNYVKQLVWTDDVYLDMSGFGGIYKDIFNDYGLDIIEIRAKSADSIIPERMEIR